MAMENSSEAHRMFISQPRLASKELLENLGPLALPASMKQGMKSLTISQKPCYNTLSALFLARRLVMVVQGL